MKECLNCWSPYKKRNKDFCCRGCYNVWRYTQKQYRENPDLLKIYRN